MSRKALPLIGVLLFLILVPFVSCNAPTLINMEYKIQGSGEAVPEQGYWVYGEFWNIGGVSKSEVLVEVTLYDDQRVVLDVLDTVISPTIVEPGAKAAFHVKSSTTTQVAETKFVVKSYTETRNTNFRYLKLSEIITRDTGVAGVLSNTHDFIYVYEAEVIASFYDAEGDIVDIQRYGANDYGKFDAGTSQAFFIETSHDFESYNLLVQCNRASLNPILRLSIERADTTVSWFNPLAGETFTLILTDDPHQSQGYVDAVVTDPNGVSTTCRFDMSGLLDFRYSITPEVGGTWNVTWKTGDYFVNGDLVRVEAAQLDTGFWVYDPDAEGSGEIIEEEPNSVSGLDENVTLVDKVKNSITSSAEEIVENLPEEYTQNIPGYPIYSLVAGLLVYFLFNRKNPSSQ